MIWSQRLVIFLSVIKISPNFGMFKCHIQFGTPMVDVLSLTPPNLNSIYLTSQNKCTNFVSTLFPVSILRAISPTFPERYFRRHFRMEIKLFEHIAECVTKYEKFFEQRRNIVQELGHSTIQKITAALCMLAFVFRLILMMTTWRWVRVEPSKCQTLCSCSGSRVW
jgi:hypothetical protein